MISVYIDGSARPNPGKGGIGIVIQGDGWDYTISEKCGDRESNNSVEYKALCRALTELMQNKVTSKEIVVFSDSELLVEQMNGNRQVDKGGKYLDDYMRARMLKRYFWNLKFKWISRKENAEANLLASKGTKR